MIILLVMIKRILKNKWNDFMDNQNLSGLICEIIGHLQNKSVRKKMYRS